MGAGTKDKMPLIIAARGTERWRAGEWEGRRSERVGKKKSKGALVCKPDTLAVTVNKLTERNTVRGRGRGEGEKKEGIKREELRKGKTQNYIKSDGEREEREKGREEKSGAPLLGGMRLHLCTTPGCYRASVYGLFIPLPPITTQ